MRSWYYWGSVMLFGLLYSFGGWWAVACATSFVLGWHFCWRKLTGRWMDPVD